MKGNLTMTNEIQSYSLFLDKIDLQDLKSDIWNDEPLPAYLKVGDFVYYIDISYRGNYTRELRKKSYWIGFVKPNSFFGAHEIHLNAEYRDPSLIRNKLSFDFFQEIGVLSPDSKHVTLTRNGTFKGVYLQVESVDEQFLLKRGLPSGPIYYAVNNSANFSLVKDGKPKDSLLSGYERKCGKPSDDQYLQEMITQLNTIPLSQFPTVIPRYLHVEKILRWLAGAVCTMNNDGFKHNYALYRNSENGLFEIIPWDYDGTWGRKISGSIMKYDYVPIWGKEENNLIYLLLQVPEFRELYRNILLDILETKFTVEHLKEKILSLHQSLRPYVILDPYKKKDINKFDSDPEVIFKFIRDRSKYLKEQMIYLDTPFCSPI